MGEGDTGTAEAIVHQLVRGIFFFPIVTLEETVTPEYVSGNRVTGFCQEQSFIFIYFFASRTVSTL